MTTPSQDHPTRSEVFDDVAPAVGAPPVYGPPVIFLLGPWLLLVLLLIPPAAFLLTIGLAMLVVAGSVAVLVAVPYLLVRRLRAWEEAHRRRRATAPVPASHRVPAGSDADARSSAQPRLRPLGQL